MLIFTLDAHEFTRSINAVRRSAATDKSRPALTGIFCQIIKSQLIVAAADGFRLSESRATVEPVNDGDPITAILELAPLLAFCKLIERHTSHVMVEPSEKHWTLKVIGRTVGVPVIDATFPDYKQLLGSGEVTELFRVDASFLMDALAAHKNSTIRVGVVPGGPTDGSAGLYLNEYVHKYDPYPATRHLIMPKIADDRTWSNPE